MREEKRIGWLERIYKLEKDNNEMLFQILMLFKSLAKPIESIHNSLQSMNYELKKLVMKEMRRR